MKYKSYNPYEETAEIKNFPLSDNPFYVLKVDNDEKRLLKNHVYDKELKEWSSTYYIITTDTPEMTQSTEFLHINGYYVYPIEGVHVNKELLSSFEEVNKLIDWKKYIITEAHTVYSESESLMDGHFLSPVRIMPATDRGLISDDNGKTFSLFKDNWATFHSGLFKPVGFNNEGLECIYVGVNNWFYPYGAFNIIQRGNYSFKKFYWSGYGETTYTVEDFDKWKDFYQQRINNIIKYY